MDPDDDPDPDALGPSARGGGEPGDRPTDAGEATTDGVIDPTAGADDADDAATDDADDGGSIGLIEARQKAIDAADQLLDHEFEGVVRIDRQDDGWRTLVEVVERSAVPDTQDIIGRYELTLDATGELTGYGLVERYRRGEMREEL